MSLERGRFYRHSDDGVVYRCEQAMDARVLLHSTDLHALPTHPRRLIVRDPSPEQWVLVPDTEEAAFIDTYSRDAVLEYGVEVGDQGMVFRRQYHLNPYLAMIDAPELRERLDIIANNCIRYDSVGHASLVNDTDYWHRKSEEMVEELRIRPREGFFTSEPSEPRARVLHMHHDFRQHSDYAHSAPWGRVPVLPPLSGPALFKFGQHSHLLDALERGILRVSRVSRYADPSLGVARIDSNELRLMLRPSPESFPIVVRDERGQPVADTSSPRDHQLAIEIGGDIDAFAWCCSEVYEPRLFVDFGADACLIVRDAREFMRRVNAGLLLHFPALQGCRGGRVRYYDPICVDEDIPEMFRAPLGPMFFKNWKYSYQAEYRFVWPVPSGTQFRQVDIRVAPLADICTLVRV